MITRHPRGTLVRAGAVLIVSLSVASFGGSAAAQTPARTPTASSAQFYASPSSVVKDANGYAVFSLVVNLGVGGGVTIASRGLYRGCVSSSLGPNGERVWLNAGGPTSVGVSAQGCQPARYVITLQRGTSTYYTLVTIRA